jgi:hypothetical protein
MQTALMIKVRAITTTMRLLRKTHRVGAVSLWFLVSVCLATSISAASGGGGEAGSASDIELLYVEVEEHQECPHCRILVRSFENLSAVQFDVIAEGDSVSFLTAWGIDRRAICELVFIDEEHWYASCDTFDFVFDSFEEWSASRPKCGDCTTGRRYVVGANNIDCGPRFIGDAKSLKQTDGIGIQAALELAEWDPAKITALKQALALVGANGCPRVSRELVDLLGADTSYKLNVGDLRSSSTVPDEVSVVLSMEQLRGLTDWLEHVVDQIP